MVVDRDAAARLRGAERQPAAGRARRGRAAADAAAEDGLRAGEDDVRGELVQEALLRREERAELGGGRLRRLLLLAGDGVLEVARVPHPLPFVEVVLARPREAALDEAE